MSGYNLPKIVGSIRKGTDIDIALFQDCLSSSSRLEDLKNKNIDHSSTKNLLLGLARLNKSKFLVCLLLFSMKVALTISGPFIINNIIHIMLDRQKQQLSFAVIVLLVVVYKLFGSVINVICDFAYSSLGFQYFAYLYWFILNNYNRLFGTFGKKINIIEYDCNIITNITYSSLTAFFYTIEIIVLYSMLIAYLKDSSPFSVFALIVSLYILGQALASYMTYRSNSKYMQQKDSRINCNITVNDNQMVLKQRQKELFANKKFLFTKLLGKLISILFPILINVYVFLIADRSSFSDEQYTILILINLIRSPISELMLAMNLNAQILNSCKRIVTLSSQQVVGSESKIVEQLIENNERFQVSNSNIITEKGNIALKVIFRYFFQTLPLVYCFGLVISSVLLTITKIYSFFITQHIIGGDCEYYHYIGLSAQILAPLLFYLMLIFCSHRVSSSLFLKLKKQIDYQILNRISGDIAAIDRTVTINLFEIFSSFSFIIGSYIYSIISLGIFWLQCVLFLFLFISLSLGVHYNRFIMRSRREVVRKELKMKAEMVKSMIEGWKINDHLQLKSTWRQIFECKEMGLLIQNFYMAIVHIILLILSLVLIITSQYLQLEALPQSILLMACLTIDSDISSLFFAAVRLQLSLVSFERVLNTLSP